MPYIDNNTISRVVEIITTNLKNYYFDNEQGAERRTSLHGKFSSALDLFYKNRVNDQALFQVDASVLKVDEKRELLKDSHQLNWYLTSANKASVKYKYLFNHADINDAVDKVSALKAFAEDYNRVENYADLDLEKLQKLDGHDFEIKVKDNNGMDDYSLLGKGVKSYILYHNYPNLFPNSRNKAYIVLYFLSGYDKNAEFVTYDQRFNESKENKKFPYSLYIFYCHKIYMAIKDVLQSKWEMSSAEMDNLRYVLVDAVFDDIFKEIDLNDLTYNNTAQGNMRTLGQQRRGFLRANNIPGVH